MVELWQKIWYSDGSVQTQAFQASNHDAAMGLAYEALESEIARQLEERGLTTVVKALCGERELVEIVP